MVTREFVLAGHAVFTVQSPAHHFTYRVVEGKPKPEHPQPAYFASVLYNRYLWGYLGMVRPADLTLRLTAKSALAADSLPVQVLQFALAYISGRTWKGKTTAGVPLPLGYDIRHAGVCGRCRRRLTTPESLDRGIGPECWEIMYG